MEDPRLPCRQCKHPFGLRAVLDHCTVSWPNQRWLWFECPECGGSSHIALSEGKIAIGDLDGGPGPCFMEEAAMEASGVRVTTSHSEVMVSYGGRKWRIPAR